MIFLKSDHIFYIGFVKNEAQYFRNAQKMFHGSPDHSLSQIALGSEPNSSWQTRLGVLPDKNWQNCLCV